MLFICWTIMLSVSKEARNSCESVSASVLMIFYCYIWNSFCYIHDTYPLPFILNRLYILHHDEVYIFSVYRKREREKNMLLITWVLSLNALEGMDVTDSIYSHHVKRLFPNEVWWRQDWMWYKICSGKMDYMQFGEESVRKGGFWWL